MRDLKFTHCFNNENEAGDILMILFHIFVLEIVFIF